MKDRWYKFAWCATLLTLAALTVVGLQVRATGEDLIREIRLWRKQQTMPTSSAEWPDAGGSYGIRMQQGVEQSFEHYLNEWTLKEAAARKLTQREEK